MDARTLRPLIIGSVMVVAACRSEERAAPAPAPPPSSPVVNDEAPATTAPPSSVAAPGTAHPDGPPRSCALRLSSGHGTMAVSFVLQNRTAEPITATYHHPLSFSLEVWAGSERLALQIPPFDGPVEPRELTVPPHDRVTIETPVTLRFAPDGQPKTSSPFEWLILSPPKDVTLRASKVFTDTPDLRCDLAAHFR